MKIDFHTHSKLGKKLPFSPKYTEWHLRQAKLAGLDAICITEHYNGTEMDAVFEYIQRQQEGDSFLTEDGLRVFVGLEIDAFEGGHFLTIGAMDDVKGIYRKLERCLKKKEHPTFLQLLEIVKSVPVLFGVSHPFRASNNIGYLQPAQLAELDFLELNGKDIALDAQNESKVKKLSDEVGLPILAGSDTHQAFQFGCICTQFSETLTTIDGLRDAIDSGSYTVLRGENTSKQVQTAKLIKSALKQVHKLGGDYVSVIFDL